MVLYLSWSWNSFHTVWIESELQARVTESEHLLVTS